MNLLTKSFLTLAAAAAISGSAFAEDISLPDPVKTGGTSLNDALANRKSSREFSPKELSTQQLSNLLWAAWGINREDGRRTAPSALNAQEIDLYVLLKSGAYIYDPAKNILKQMLADDIRPLARGKNAPVEILFITNLEKQNRLLSGTDVGFIGQNVYLHCAAEGLATYFRGALDNEGLQKRLELPKTKEVLYAQSVGFPVEKK